MDSFKEYVASSGKTAAPETERLKEILENYPWFTTARIVLNSREHKVGPRLALHLVNRPAPKEFLKEFSADELARVSQEEIIDGFLERGEHRIVPKGTEDADNVDDKLASLSDVDDDIVSEELARIYSSQRLYDKAVAMYRKLILRYPEKSIYFAKILVELEKEMNQKN